MYIKRKSTIFSAPPKLPMDTPSALNYIILEPMDIKEEALDQTFSLISPPITPSHSYTLPHLPSPSRRKASISSFGSKRSRPYSLVDRALSRNLVGDSMSNSTYSPWSSTGRRNPQVDRNRSSDAEAFSMPQQYMSVCHIFPVSSSRTCTQRL